MTLCFAAWLLGEDGLFPLHFELMYSQVRYLVFTVQISTIVSIVLPNNLLYFPFGILDHPCIDVFHNVFKCCNISLPNITTFGFLCTMLYEKVSSIFFSTLSTFTTCLLWYFGPSHVQSSMGYNYVSFVNARSIVP